MSKEPWNQWRGLHEGEMAAEIAELDFVSLGLPTTKEEILANNTGEQVRMMWWLTIGRHNEETGEE